MKGIGVLTIGSEILDGRILNTNTQYFAKALLQHNLLIKQMLTCDDDLKEISDSLDSLFKNVDYVIISGGLGPTADDLTRQAIAEYSNCKLEISQQALNDLNDWCLKKKRTLSDANRVQAYLPASAKIVRNPNGTAPGFILKFNNRTIAALPGIPRELIPMFEDSVTADILSNFPDRKKVYSISFRTFGIPESDLGTRINKLNLSPDIKLAYQVIFPEVKLVLRSENPEILQQACEAIRSEIADLIVSEDDLSLPQQVHKLLLEKKLKLATAESCTGGKLASLITLNSGASAFYKGSVIAYSNEIKERILKVPNETLNKFGAVSEDVVLSMAKNLCDLMQTECGIAVSGIAGPEGGTLQKPVGTVWIAVKVGNKLISKEYFLNYSRELFMQIVSYRALDMLRRILLGLELN